MVVKKQLRKISKKIMILGLATSIIFTSCFSTKKIEAHAASVAAGLSALTLYEICMYIGGLTATALGIGYAYENRDELAELGKNIIDTMTYLPEEGWILGSSTTDGDYVYGTEALKEVQQTEWTVIQGGGNSPKNDNDGDGDKDEDDIVHELNLNGYFLTQAGLNLFKNHIKPMYDSWVQKDLDNLFNEQYGISDAYHFDGTFPQTEAGKYYGYCTIGKDVLYIESDKKVGIAYIYNSTWDIYEGILVTQAKTPLKVYKNGTLVSGTSNYYDPNMHLNFDLPEDLRPFSTSLPMFDNVNDCRTFLTNGTNYDKLIDTINSFRIADWLADENYWQGILEDLALSLRSLQGLSNIAQEFADSILEYRPTVNIAGDTLNEIALNYSPLTNIIISPTYYPVTNTTPHLDISVFPNYDININPDIGGGGELPPDDGGSDDDGDNNNSNFDIDLPTLSIMFELIYLMVMIVVMLLFVFLACLGFIVMIFRIPASSNMLPEDMVLGFEHLKTIMIPGFNISIFDFAMALIYLFIVFTVIKIIRLEINDYGIPKSRKGG